MREAVVRLLDVGPGRDPVGQVQRIECEIDAAVWEAPQETRIPREKWVDDVGGSGAGPTRRSTVGRPKRRTLATKLTGAWGSAPPPASQTQRES